MLNSGLANATFPSVDVLIYVIAWILITTTREDKRKMRTKIGHIVIKSKQVYFKKLLSCLLLFSLLVYIPNFVNLISGKKKKNFLGSVWLVFLCFISDSYSQFLFSNFS